MPSSIANSWAILGLFEKRFAGDDSLLELACQRFQEAGLGVEMYADRPEDLEHVLRFRPSPTNLAMAHLSRDCNLVEERSQRQILDFAARFAGRIDGLVIHDHPAIALRGREYAAAAAKLNRQLLKTTLSPRVFVEYAAGIEPAQFVDFFSLIGDLERIGPCIDIGHVGIRETRAAYARRHGGEDICALKTKGALRPEAWDTVESAVLAGRLAVLELIEHFASGNRPVHFHLHDGHPLSTLSPFGVSDHLSFLSEIPWPGGHRENRTAAPMFGPAGLTALIARVALSLGLRRCSFTLEIHPTGERLSLGDATRFFGHWIDRTNAEKTNHWLKVLSRNHLLLREAIESASPRDRVDNAVARDPSPDTE